MARYIDADKFAERIKLSPAFKNMRHEGDLLQRVVLDLLDNAPTADVVEVVRCEKCRAFDEYHYPIEDFDGRCILDGIERDKDFYCAYGKRK